MRIAIVIIAMLTISPAFGADVFGPTFGDELKAAGLGDGISWTAGGQIVDLPANFTPAQKATLAAVQAAHDPTKQRPVLKTDAAKLVDALIAQGVVPALKRQAIVDALK